MAVSSLVFSDFQWSCVHTKRLWRNAIASALSTHFMKLLRLMCDQTPTISRSGEQEPLPSDAHTVAGRAPAVAATTPRPFAACPGQEP